jgi:peptide/nickel transport system substrate-binding protein
LNTAVAPFDDLDVRKAVLAGFDREAALLALGGKRVGTVANHFLPPGVPGFEQAGGVSGTGADYLASPSGDPALAASYMKQAGYASGRYSGEPILMVGPVDGNGRRISEIAKQAFTSLGFEVKLRLMSQQAVMTKYCGAPAAAVAVCPNVGWTRDFADGQTFLDPTFNGEHITPVGNANVSQLNVKAVNEAIENATTLTDPAARADAWGGGRSRDHRAGPGRAARVGQGADGGVGGRERRGERESRRLGLLFHVFAKVTSLAARACEGGDAKCLISAESPG